MSSRIDLMLLLSVQLLFITNILLANALKAIFYSQSFSAYILQIMFTPYKRSS